MNSPICDWCRKLPSEYELAIYKLANVRTWHKNGATQESAYMNLGRGDLYVKVRICTKCLPVTKVSETTILESYERVVREPAKDV